MRNDDAIKDRDLRTNGDEDASLASRVMSHAGAGTSVFGKALPLEALSAE